MDNADKPAMPIVDRQGAVTNDRSGLTKREHFAGLAMQGMLSNSAQSGTYAGLADAAVAVADALLKELDK